MGRLATSKDGTRIAFEKTGSGPAVIVISGALSHRGLYRDQVLPARLSEHFTVYLYDRRGRGESTDVQPYAVAREIEDIDVLLDDAGGSGYLYGVALEAMKRSPEWEAIKKIDFTLAYDYAVLGDGDVPQEIVKAIRVPTLVMNGEKSMDFMGPAADRIAALVPQSQRKTLKGQAHQVEAEVMVPVLVEFFTGSSLTGSK